MDAFHEDESWDTQLTCSVLTHRRGYSPHPQMCLAELLWCGRGRQLLLKSRGIMPAGKCVPLCAQHSQSHMAHLLTKLQFQSHTFVPAYSQITTSATTTALCVIYIECCQVFGKGRGLQFLPVQTTGQAMLWLCTDKEERKEGSSSQGTHELSSEVRTCMPVALPDKEHHPFPFTGHNLLSLHHPLPWAVKPDCPQARAHSRAGASTFSPTAEEVAIYFSSTAL